MNKRYLKKWENPYLTVRNRCLICLHASALLHLQNVRKNSRGPLDQIMDPFVRIVFKFQHLSQLLLLVATDFTRNEPGYVKGAQLINTYPVIMIHTYIYIVSHLLAQKGQEVWQMISLPLQNLRRYQGVRDDVPISNT